MLNVRVIKTSTLRSGWQKHPDAKAPLRRWLKVTLAARWQSIDDARSDFPHADAITVASGNTVTTFNMAGHKYRLIVSIKYRYGVLYVTDFLTHAQYSKNPWKGRPIISWC